MQGVVIQGSTGYVNEVIDLYKDIPNVVFSTWEGEPKENIQLIKSKGIEVIQSPKPLVSGNFNVNLQAFGVRLKRLNINGILIGKHTNKGDTKIFDFVKLKEHFKLNITEIIETDEMEEIEQ